MSQWSHLDRSQRAREEFYFGGPPPDPVEQARRAGRPYFRKGCRGHLMPDDFIPIGAHAGKTLRNVPVDYLLWVDGQPWARTWAAWRPVADYISRFITCRESGVEAAVPVGPVIFVDALVERASGPRCFRAGSAHLHTLPGHEDLLHAFAAGALGLRQAWYQKGCPPHYDVTVGKHKLAVSHGATLIDRTRMREHIQTWRAWFDSKRQPASTEPT